MKILDRYLIRETLPPFLLALAVYTFILAIRPALDHAEMLLAKNVPMQTVAYLLLTLLPQALGVAIPMAFLTGLLMAFGRLSGDREAVALLACGVRPARLLRPVLMLALVVGLVNMYVLMRAVPDSNQAFRDTTFGLLTQQSESDVKPGLFYEGFPGLVLHVSGTDATGRWAGVMVADTSRPGRPSVTLAESGHLELDADNRRVNLWLFDALRHEPGADPLVYDLSGAEQLRLPINADVVFGDGSIGLTRGLAESDWAALREREAAVRARNESPHNEIMFRHQMLSFPVACLVFALLSLPLGLHTRKEGKLAGFTLGLAVIMVYWVLLAQFEDLTKGGSFPAHWARWMPNIALALVGAAALWWRRRPRSTSLSIRLPAWLTAVGQGGRPRPQQAGPSSNQTVVVLRLPAFAIPRPRLLDSYVASRYLRIIGLSFVGLLGLNYIGQFIELSDKLFKEQATTADLLTFFWYSTPQFITYIAPIATLVAVLGTIGALSRTGELTVMRACGISLYRLASPLVLLALVWSVGLFVLEERVLASANRVADVLSDQIRGRPPRTVNIENRNWLIDQGRIYYFSLFDKTNDKLYGLSIFDTAQRPYRLTRHTYLREAQFVDEHWEAIDGWEQRFVPGSAAPRESFESTRLDLAPLADFERSQVDADLMSFGEQRAYVQQLRTSGYSVARQEVELHKKLAFPLVTVVMTLLAIPFAVTSGRRGALYGIGLAIGLAFGYWLLTTVFMAAGSAGLLPPVLAAWATNVFFITAALYLILTVRT